MPGQNSQKALLGILLFIHSFSTHAQWNSFHTYSTFISLSIPGSLNNADFITEDTGLYIIDYALPGSTSGYQLKQSMDAAQHWTTTASNGGIGIHAGSLCISRKDRTPYFIESNMGMNRIYKSEDNGGTWKSIFSLTNGISDFFPMDSNSIYILHYSNSNYLGYYHHGTWTPNLATFSNYIPARFFFTDTLNGFLSAYPSVTTGAEMLMRTSDGGATWDTSYVEQGWHITDFAVRSNGNGCMTGNSGKIYSTTDMGMSWQTTLSPVNSRINSLFFLNDTAVFAAGNGGVILHSYNGGQTWTKDSTSTSGDFSKVFFVNDSIGFALDITGGAMFKTNLRSTVGIWSPVIEKSNLTIYPNPSHARTTLRLAGFTGTGEGTLTMYDQLGKYCFCQTVNFTSNEISIDLPETKGLYSVVLQCGNRWFSGRLSVE